MEENKIGRTSIQHITDKHLINIASKFWLISNLDYELMFDINETFSAINFLFEKE